MKRDPDATELIVEIQRYLAAVDVFRAEGREPAWRPEPTWWLIADDHARARERTGAAHNTGANSSH